MICPYCGQGAPMVTGSMIYPHRPDLAAKTFYRCEPCQAWVGCHPGTVQPLGRLADAKLRKAKSAAHSVFDPLWIHGRLSRAAAYARLSAALGIPAEETHIGMFDESLCWRAVEACKVIRRQLREETT